MKQTWKHKYFLREIFRLCLIEIDSPLGKDYV